MIERDIQIRSMQGRTATSKEDKKANFMLEPEVQTAIVTKQFLKATGIESHVDESNIISRH